MQNASLNASPVKFDSKRSSPMRAGLAGGVGTLIEYYDFGVYGYLTLFIAPLFFHSDNSATSVLATLAVFGVAYVARPFGGFFFGTLGDRMGRKPALVLSVILMGACSSLLGLLPTYSVVGLLAPVLLVLLRLLQGFCAGGEASGSATYIAESAPARRRGLFGSFTPVGSTMGFAVAAAVVGVVSMTVGSEAMATWGWRIPFLLSIPLTVVCLVVRTKLNETPTAVTLRESEDRERHPFVRVVVEHPKAVLKVVGIAVAMNGTGYVGLTYFSVYLIQDAGYSAASVQWVSAGAIALACLTYPFSGLLSDVIGRKRTLFIGYIGYILIAFPAFLMLGAGNSLVLVFIVYFVYMALNGVLQVPAFPLFTELFPGRVRYSAVALGFNLGTIVAGGTAPYVSAQLVSSTGSGISPAFWVIGVSLIGLVTLLSIKETANRDLLK